MIFAAVAATLLAAGCAGASPGSATVAAAASPLRPASLATHGGAGPARVAGDARGAVGPAHPPLAGLRRRDHCDGPDRHRQLRPAGVLRGLLRRVPGRAGQRPRPPGRGLAGVLAPGHDPVRGTTVREARVAATVQGVRDGRPRPVPARRRHAGAPGGELPGLGHLGQPLPLLPAPAPVAVRVVARHPVALPRLAHLRGRCLLVELLSSSSTGTLRRRSSSVVPPQTPWA